IGWRVAVRAPAQQVAMLLTAVSVPWLVSQDYRLAEDLAAAAQATGSVPVGATGLPLALWWAAGRQLTDLAQGIPDARGTLRASIGELAGAHGRQLGYAQLDGYHWPAALARVDLVDLDLAGLVAMSDRAMRSLDLPGWNLTEDFGGLDPLARVSVT